MCVLTVKKKSTNSDGLEMTPHVVKPPFMHDRGQKGPLYFQTSATYDALIVEKNDDIHSSRPRTTPNRHRVAMSGRKDSSARESIQDKAKILNILYDPKLDMSRTAPLPSHLAEHKIKLDLEKQKSADALAQWKDIVASTWKDARVVMKQAPSLVAAGISHP